MPHSAKAQILLPVGVVLSGRPSSCGAGLPVPVISALQGRRTSQGLTVGKRPQHRAP